MNTIYSLPIDVINELILYLNMNDYKALIFTCRYMSGAGKGIRALMTRNNSEWAPFEILFNYLHNKHRRRRYVVYNIFAFASRADIEKFVTYDTCYYYSGIFAEAANAGNIELMQWGIDNFDINPLKLDSQFDKYNGPDRLYIMLRSSYHSYAACKLKRLCKIDPQVEILCDLRF